VAAPSCTALADELTRPYFFMRTGALSLAYVHLAFTSNRQGSPWRIGLGAFALVVVVFGFAALTLGPFFAAGLDASLGADPEVATSYLPVHNCMYGVSDHISVGGQSVPCSIAHFIPRDTVRALTALEPQTLAHTSHAWAQGRCRAGRVWVPCPRPLVSRDRDREP
jgi:hypothetical protein